MATPTLDRPAPNPDNNKNRKFLEGPKKVIAILLGTGALGLAGYQALDRDMTGTVHDIADNTKSQYDKEMADRGYDVTNGDPVKIDVPQQSENGMEHIAVQYPTTIVAQGEIRESLDEHSKNFDEWRSMLFDIHSGELSSEQLQFLQTNYASLSTKSDKSDYTDNEILAVTALDIMDATSQQHASVGREMVKVVYNERAGNYGQAMTLADNERMLVDVWRQFEGAVTYERPKDHYFQGDDIGQVKDARVIVRKQIPGKGGEGDVGPQSELVTVYVLNSDGNGNEQWQRFGDYSWDDESVREELHSLHPQNQGR